MLFGVYQPKLVIAWWAEIQFLGYATDSMINVAKAEDDYEMVPGCQGDVVLVQKENPIGSVTVRLQAESPVNDLLSARATISRKFRPVVKPFMMKYIAGTTICKSAFSVLAKVPDIEYTNGENVREWTILCADLDMFAGGNSPIALLP